MKKRIKIKFIGFWSGFDEMNNLFSNILKERYDVEISGKPDYLFYSPLVGPYKYADYNCVRIMFAGEPFSADYNACDYAIDFDEYSFGDRHMRYPIYLYSPNGPGKKREQLSDIEVERLIAEKQYFCNFIYGHKTVDGKREKIFELISKYKKVDSIGRFRNNMENGEIATFGENGSKREYLLKSKFTIAVESMKQPGFTTEKIKDAFDNFSIPIYYGNDEVDKEFNEKSFINLNKFSSLEDGVEYIAQVDQNPELYKQMLKQCEFVDPNYPENKYEELKKFLFNIFDQELESAYRRNRFYICENYNVMQQYTSRLVNTRIICQLFYLFQKQVSKHNRT